MPRPRFHSLSCVPAIPHAGVQPEALLVDGARQCRVPWHLHNALQVQRIQVRGPFLVALYLAIKRLILRWQVQWMGECEGRASANLL